MNVLWISLRVPYDQVRHASGRIENYYIKKLIQEDSIDLKLITFSKKSEIEIAKKDHFLYNIDSDIYLWDTSIRAKIERQLVKINPYDTYGGGTIPFYWSRINLSLKTLRFNPDVIILDWTEMLLFLPKFKEIFPNAKYISIEEDVLLLNFQRQYEHCSKSLKKYILKRKYERLRSLEIEQLKECDLVVLNNPKDKKLVEGYGVRNTWCWSPYFQNLSSIITYKKKTKDILYYGSMSRPENHLSVMRLINKILPKIKDPEVRLIILGNGPQDSLIKLQSDRIIVTGFVDDITPYFESALCLCAPLVLGAGVKIKIIESMSAGLIVLTNDIGIEGIPAVDRRDYLHCESNEDFIKYLDLLLTDEIDVHVFSDNAKRFVKAEYDNEKDSSKFLSLLFDLTKGKRN